MGLVFVALDLSAPAAAILDKSDGQITVTVFSPLSRMLQGKADNPGEYPGAGMDYLKNILLPFIIYLFACCGFVFLISENIRLWKIVIQTRPDRKLMWTIWIALLGLMCLMVIYLCVGLVFTELWYIFAVAAILLLFYWIYWASRN